MRSSKIISVFLAFVALFSLGGPLSAQERLKKVRITYPTESIAVLPLFAASRWKTFEDNDLQAEIIQARSYLLLARPEFANIRDLRNKKIGLTGLGGTSHVALQIAMESMGENPKNFIYLSITAAQTMAALETGVIDAARLRGELLRLP